MASRSTLALIILIIPVGYIYGLSFLSLILGPETSGITPATLLISLILNLVIMVGASAAYIYARYGGTWRTILYRLFYRRKHIIESVALGIATGIILLMLSAVIVLIYQALGFDVTNTLAESIVETLDVGLVIAIPPLAAVSEETFFRGLLQMELARWQGQPLAIVVTAALFGLAHLAYGNILQILIPFLLGGMLAVLMMKTRNIAAPIAAHFVFNFIQLALAYLVG
jgi:membrane protease YdiL (CAAX protease family)